MQYNDNARLDTSEVSDTRVAVAVGWAAVAGWPWAAAVSAWSAAARRRAHQRARRGRRRIGRGGDSRPARAERPAGHRGQLRDPAELPDRRRTPTTSSSARSSPTSTRSRRTGLPSCPGSAPPTPRCRRSGSAGRCRPAAARPTSGSGPFYCPADKRVYIDLTFYDDLQDRSSAPRAGCSSTPTCSRTSTATTCRTCSAPSPRCKPGETGPTSGSVRLELQADCYAGVWAKHATEPGPNGEPAAGQPTSRQDDINRALDTAARIGDDYIQTEPRQRARQPERIHARLVGAAAEVVQHRLPDAATRTSATRSAPTDLG